MQNENQKLAGMLTAMTAAVAVGLRLARIPNIFAVGALGLYTGARLPLWIAWVPSMAVMAITDLILKKWFAYPAFDLWAYAGFLVYVLLGRLLSGSRSPWRIGAVTILGSVLFNLIVDFGTWYVPHGVEYPKTWAGLIECYTMGLPFLKYTLIGDFVCTAAVFGAEALLAQPASKPAAEEVRA